MISGVQKVIGDTREVTRMQMAGNCGPPSYIHQPCHQLSTTLTLQGKVSGREGLLISDTMHCGDMGGCVYCMRYAMAILTFHVQLLAGAYDTVL